MGRATVGMVSVVYPQALPESGTLVGRKLGAGEVTIEGKVVWLGVMVPLYPGWTWIEKSTTLAVCEANEPNGPPFALAPPETVTWGGSCTGGVGLMIGVTSTSTAAMAPTARVEIEQVIMPCCTMPQFPEPLVTLAMGFDAIPVEGTLALKTTRLAGSLAPPRLELVISKVNAT